MMTRGLIVALLMAAVVPLAAQGPAGNRRIEGHWVRVDAAGSGSFGGLAAGFTPAVLTPEAAKAAAAARAGGPGGAGGPGPAAQNAAGGPLRPGQALIVVDRPCANNPARGNGAVLMNPDSGGIHIIEHKDEVILSGDRGGARHIYLDGRPHPPLASRVPRAAGHSIGRYDGNVLVVDTIGLTPAAVVAGGQRTPETRLTERFEVAPDGQRMTITYTWQDPKIYQKPHTYTYHFERLPAGSYVFEDWCDASDPIERQGVVPPVQNR